MGFQSNDSSAFAAADKCVARDELAARVNDGDLPAVGGGLSSREPMALLRTLVRGNEQADAAEANIKVAMQDARAAVLPDGTTWTWAPTKHKGYTVEESIVRTLRRKGTKNGAQD